MLKLPAVLLFTALTFLCWGAYGPVLHHGVVKLEGNSMLAFFYVGIAYFAIAVVTPIVALRTQGEGGRWTLGGVIWSLLAGVAGAIGALGVTLAFKAGGNYLFVMPTIFGLAPVINTFFTMAMARSLKAGNPIFYAGVLLVALGGAGVILLGQARGGETSFNLLVIFWTIVTAICWGIYGPVLHRGQTKMEGSRLRPFMCVGGAYFLIAILVPLGLLGVTEVFKGVGVGGSLWSLAAGTAGAVGALGVIMAFNFGGRPIFVMPIIFGGAPVVNTVIYIVGHTSDKPLSPLFYAALMLVILGAVTVLVFAPKPSRQEKKAHRSFEKGKEAGRREAEREEEKHSTGADSNQPSGLSSDENKPS